MANRRHYLSGKLFSLLLPVSLSLLIAAGLATDAIAGSFQTIYRFCSGEFPACPGGTSPNGGVLVDKTGIYGTAANAGANGKGGVVYKLTPRSKIPYKQTVLYSFCSEINSNGYCTDGEVPSSNLIMDANGNLYGTTVGGGANNRGTVFELTPSGDTYQETVLYNFCSVGGSNCTDGQGPFAGVVMDANGDLFGTTNTGGANQINDTGAGVVFELIPNDTKTAYTENVIYNFCSQSSSQSCTDGLTPYAGLLMDQYGDLFGTTAGGGTGSGGVVYELTPNEAGTVYTETVLYPFCSQSDCADGDYPGFEAPLITDGKGDLYGVTEDGGGSNHGGVVFELTPNQGAYDESVIYSFCRTGGTKCTDGEHPDGGLILNDKGILHGTTSGGGKRGDGALFKLTPNKSKTVYTESVLHSFCTEGRPGYCTDGLGPVGNLSTDTAGNLYGTANSGGTYGEGTVFKATP